MRNLDRYGIRAPGEFRHRYLLIGVALYVAVFFDTVESRLRLLRVFSSLTVFTIVAAMPVVAFVSGWTPGSGERLFPADVSLTFLFGRLDRPRVALSGLPAESGLEGDS